MTDAQLHDIIANQERIESKIDMLMRMMGVGVPGPTDLRDIKARAAKRVAKEREKQEASHADKM